MPATGLTPSNLITLGLKKANVLGVGQVALPEDMNDMFTELNLQIAEWQTDRFLVYQETEVICEMTGAESYTIGPGQQINIARPERIEQAFVRQNPTGSPTPVDYPLEMLFSREDYARIRLKFLGSWPQCIYYDRGFPTGNIYVWPLPNSTFELHLLVMQQLQSFATINDTINLPLIYQRLFIYQIAMIAYAQYGLPPNPIVVQTLKKTLSRLRAMNAEVPRLVTGDINGSTNIYDPYNAGSN
jgi:hypothetical protein